MSDSPDTQYQWGTITANCRAKVVPYSEQQAPGDTQHGKEYLCYLIHRLLDFRMPEMESVAHMFGVKHEELTWRRPYKDHAYSPLWYLRGLPSEDVVAKVASRAMLVRGFFELWGEGSSWEELEASIQAYPQHLKEPWLAEGRTFKIVVDTYGFKNTFEEQLQQIERLRFIDFKGKVDLVNPETKFWLIEMSCKENNGLPDSLPARMYFGRQVAISDRSVVDTYALRKRGYIGPTSMDHEMSFVMANMALARPHSLVMDPYCGTGSIIVAAAVRGARVMGADIDHRVITMGKVDKSGRAVDVWTNFQQYGLQPPVGLLRCDMHRHPFRQDLQEILDAMIGDPPYGVRAGGRKSAPKDNPVTDITTHVPSTDPYSLGECLRDLLEVAARLLRVGGRLVYFMPATPETYTDAEVPTHPMLELVANSEQLLTCRYSRRLITMEKVRPYDSAAEAAFLDQRPDPTMAIDRIHEMVYESNKGKESEQRLGTRHPKYRSKLL